MNLKRFSPAVFLMQTSCLLHKVPVQSRSRTSLVVVWKKWILTQRKANMTMENQTFEDAPPIENGDFPLPC